MSEACSGNGISLKKNPRPSFPLPIHTQTAVSGSDITTINHKRLIEPACLLPEKFSHTQITSPDKKHPHHLAKTNIPFNSHPICYTNKCFFLKEDFNAPENLRHCKAVQRDCRATPKKLHGSHLKTPLLCACQDPFHQHHSKHILPTPQSELGTGEGRSEGIWGTLLGVCLQGASTACGNLAGACSHSQSLLMLPVIAFGKNQAVNQRRGKKFQGSKSRMFSIMHVC